MGESIVKIPQCVASDMDFLAFSFNGKHSWDDFGIYRVSDGDRYNENLTPALNDKTAEVSGGDGMYYFGTTYKQREFNISFAFDGLTEDKLHKMKKWLNGKELGDLWFSEAPYKVWTAKPTGNSAIKYIPFDSFDSSGNKIRIYKGEGSVVFTAFWPYAHTPDYVLSGSARLNGNYHASYKQFSNYEEIKENLPLQKDSNGVATEQAFGDLPFYFSAQLVPPYKTSGITIEVNIDGIDYNASDVEHDSTNGEYTLELSSEEEEG